MVTDKLLIISACLVQLALPVEYDMAENMKLLPKRLNNLMQKYLDRSVEKVQSVQHLRASYEVSPHYEMGYVMSELLERYRKMVNHTKFTVKDVSLYVFETLKLAELLQSLFLEIYHLTNMFHEIPRKYSLMREFQEELPYDRHVVQEAIVQIEESQKWRNRMKKQKLKELKKEREMYIKGEIAMAQRPRRPRNIWWPIDYGWEIEYDWAP